MADKKKFQSYVTPRGVAVYPKLNTPDTKFSEQGMYTVKLAFDPDSDPKAAAFLAQLEELHEAGVEAMKEENRLTDAKIKATKVDIYPVVTDELDADTSEPTGRKLVNFKSYATKKGDDGKTMVPKDPPRLFDSKGKPITKESRPNIGSGSVLIVEFSVAPYYTAKKLGVSLYIAAVQLIKLVEWTGGAGNFEAQDDEDGYSVGAESEFGAAAASDNGGDF